MTNNELSEFRQDLVSGEWVLFSSERGKYKPKSKERAKFYQPKEGCPFENLQQNGEQPLAAYLNGKKIDLPAGGGDFKGQWTTQVIKNRYPALKQGACGPKREHGPFKVADGNGFHELVITKDHDKSFAQFTQDETKEVLAVFKDRYLAISKDPCGDYISIFHNHGSWAGGSIYHNHSQILSSPILPPEILSSMRGSMDYFNKNKKKVHDEMINWEIKEKKRIIHENEKFIAFCPYVSKTSYEVRIFPKVPSPCFHNIDDDDLIYLADVMRVVLAKIYKALDNIDYNFYIHTAPVTKDEFVDYDFYHWHMEVVPRTSKIGAFELGTDIYINVVDPDQAAELLRKTDIKN
jgi:UDPglucose--hexose-1-phosphate uridylyltransferase